jgi:uncharacterized membrane protein YkvA (DUF1232 family)
MNPIKFLSNRYKKHPWATLIFGVLYVLSPVDLAPDFFPILGQADDAVVIAALAYNLIKRPPWEKQEEE